MTRLLIWLYRGILRLYPRDFRAEFGPEMLALFLALVNEASHPGGRLAIGIYELVGGLRGAAGAQYHALLAAERGPFSRFQQLLGVITIGFIGGWLGLYVALDRALAVSRYAWFTGIVLLAGVLICGLLIRSMPTRRHLVVLALFVVLTIGVRWVDWDTRKPFLRALDQVRPGMELAAVDQIMAGYLRAPAAPGTLGSPRHVTYRHTNEWWGDSDWGVVTFDGDRVVRVEFLPD